jgi:hypothetical protein
VPGRETAPGFVLSDVSRRDKDLRRARKQGASPMIPALILRLIFVVICGGSRRTSLSLHAKFPGLVNLVVIYNEPL